MSLKSLTQIFTLIQISACRKRGGLHLLRPFEQRLLFLSGEEKGKEVSLSQYEALNTVRDGGPDCKVMFL